jgi:hypothetical protein
MILANAVVVGANTDGRFRLRQVGSSIPKGFRNALQDGLFLDSALEEEEEEEEEEGLMKYKKSSSVGIGIKVFVQGSKVSKKYRVLLRAA